LKLLFLILFENFNLLTNKFPAKNISCRIKIVIFTILPKSFLERVKILIFANPQKIFLFSPFLIWFLKGQRGQTKLASNLESSKVSFISNEKKFAKSKKQNSSFQINLALNKN